MNQLEEIRAILTENERYCQIIGSSTSDEGDGTLILKSPQEKPVYELSFSLAHFSQVVNTPTITSYDLATGNAPTLLDLLNAHKTVETKRIFGSLKTAKFMLTQSNRILASAQFALTKKALAEPNLVYSNAHIKGTLVEKLGEGTVVTGQFGSQNYTNVVRVMSPSLSELPYIITNPLDCAKFMHGVYSLLLKKPDASGRV